MTRANDVHYPNGSFAGLFGFIRRFSRPAVIGLKTITGLCVAVFLQMALGVGNASANPPATNQIYHCPFVAGSNPATAGRPDTGEMKLYTGGRPFIRINLAAVDPLAVCNDGSPGVMYVRKAPATLPNGNANPHASKFHIHIKGGGGCKNRQECEKRWCGVGGGLNSPGLMSSEGTKIRASVKGLFNNNPTNRFFYYNQVVLFYCSSDSWLGDRAEPQNVIRPNTAGAFPAFVMTSSPIEFRGARIVNTAMSQLTTAGGFSYFNPHIDSMDSLPNMGTADAVFFSGDSAGGVGLRHHIDRLKTDINSLSATVVPVYAALDAGGVPDLNSTVVPASYGGGPPGSQSAGWANYTAMMTEVSDNYMNYHGATTANSDISCFAMAANPDSCFDTFYLQKHHITTPLFHRVSLYDHMKVDSFVNKAEFYATAPDLGFASEIAAREFRLPGIELRAQMSVMAPSCDKHVVFRNNTVFSHTTSSGGVSTYSRLADFAATCEAGACSVVTDIDTYLTPMAYPGC